MHTCEVLLSKFQSHHKGHLMRHLKSNHNKKTDAQICQLTFSWSWMLYLNPISLCVIVCGVCVCIHVLCIHIQRPEGEEDTGCFSLSLPALSPRQRFSPWSRSLLFWLSWLPGQWAAPGIHLSLPLYAAVAGIYSYTRPCLFILFYCSHKCSGYEFRPSLNASTARTLPHWAVSPTPSF